MKNRRMVWWLVAGMLIGIGCKSGDDDDSGGGAGMGATGTGGMAATGTGGMTAGGTGGMTAGGTGGMTAGGTGGMTAGGTGGMTAGGTGGMTAGGTGGMMGTGGMTAGGTGGMMGTGGMTAGGTGGMASFEPFMAGTTGDMAVATIAKFGDGHMVSGTATFTQNDGNTSVMIELADCEDGMHPVHIHQGTSCDTADTQMGHWDMMRGEGIPNVMCTNGTGTGMFMRPDTDPLPWSVGGDKSSDVIGHVFVVHNMDDMKTRIGCGPIVAK